MHMFTVFLKATWVSVQYPKDTLQARQKIASLGRSKAWRRNLKMGIIPSCYGLLVGTPTMSYPTLPCKLLYL